MDIIDNYGSLPLGRYLDILEVNRDESLDNLDRQVKILSILSDIPEEEILHLPIHEYKEMVGKSLFLEQPDTKPGRVAKEYALGGMRLIPVTDYRKIETCQYVDFQTFAPEMETKMVELISVLLVPKGHRYNEGYDILDVQEAIRKDMSVADAVTLCAFFLRLCGNSIADSLNSCRSEARRIKDRAKREEMERMISRAETALNGNGDGSPM